MYFTTQPNLTFRSCIRAAIAEITHLTATFFRRRNSGSQRRAGTKAGVGHAQWSKDIFLRKLIERHSTNARDNLAERDETDVAVGEASAGRIAERFLISRLIASS